MTNEQNKLKAVLHVMEILDSWAKEARISEFENKKKGEFFYLYYGGKAESFELVSGWIKEIIGEIE